MYKNQWNVAISRGGHWPRKGVWGCAAVMTPFFQATRRSLAYQCTIIAPLLCPPFSNLRKIFHFQPCFGQNFSSQDANFRSPDPSFFKENPLPRPYFWKPVWHTPTKKKVECPPPPPPGAISPNNINRRQLWMKIRLCTSEVIETTIYHYRPFDV